MCRQPTDDTGAVGPGRAVGLRASIAVTYHGRQYREYRPARSREEPTRSVPSTKSVQTLQTALHAKRREVLSESRMREIRMSGSMSGV